MTAEQLSQKDGKVFHADLLNENVRKAEYAVRGELHLRAVELEKKGMDIIYTNSAFHAPYYFGLARPS